MDIDFSEIKILDKMYDKKMLCHSVLIKLPIVDYLNLIKPTYKDDGGIEGQRAPLTTNSAKIIRKRMVADLKKGAIMPPIVLGMVISNSITATDLDNSDEISDSIFLELLKNCKPEQLTIIDGIQRTTAYYDASINDGFVRVEVWLTNKIQKLTYRMLVLNTGQTPWDLRRQIEVVYQPLFIEIEAELNKDSELKGQFIINKKTDKSAEIKLRTKAGIYNSKDFIELYMAFGLKSEKVDIKDNLASKFSELDMVDSLSNDKFFSDFIFIFSWLCKLDLAFGKFNSLGENDRFINGQDIFKSQPAKIGFMAAAARTIYGIPGTENSAEKIKKQLSKIETQCQIIQNLVLSLDEDNQQEFFSFDKLNEAINKLPSKNIGEQERAFFRQAFKTLFEEYDLSDPASVTLNPLWVC